MTDTQGLKRIYMLLRWYDSYAESLAAQNIEVPEEDMRLMLELEKESRELQARALRAKKNKSKKCISRAKTSQTKHK